MKKLFLGVTLLLASATSYAATFTEETPACFEARDMGLFLDAAQIENFEIGAMLFKTDRCIQLPTWVTYTIVQEGYPISVLEISIKGITGIVYVPNIYLQ